MDRRSFVKVSAIAGGGALFAISFGANLGKSNDSVKNFSPNAWIKIFPDNRIIFILDRTEMGQGVTTALAMLVAEELEVSLDHLEIEHAPADKMYITPEFRIQMTGGSSSVRTSYDELRKAGATTRMMLIAAAAKRWGISESECYAENARIFSKNKKSSGTFGEFVDDAAKMQVPTPVLKTAAQHKLIGKSQKRLDAPAKVDGTAVFGIDSEPKDVCYAYVIRSPYIGGNLKGFDADSAKKSPGVIDVVKIPAGIAVVAKQYWQALKAAELVTASWERGTLGRRSSTDIYKEFADKLPEDGRAFEERGDFSQAKKLQDTVIETIYSIPYMAHATMEPMNCTAHVYDGKCEVWAPTQAVGLAQQAAAVAAGINREDVIVHQTLIGGGFGRRLAQDYVFDAVSIAKAVKRPVKMIMSREDDFKNDVYRPGSLHKLSAGISNKGELVSWQHKMAGPSILAQISPEWSRAMFPSWVPEWMKDAGSSMAGKYVGWSANDPTATEGANDLCYAVPNVNVSFVLHDPGIPVGFWRAVGHSFTGFVVESFIDECAFACKADPLTFRLSLLKDHPQRTALLNHLVEKSDWMKRRTAGAKLGIAQTLSFGSYAAAVIEVEVVDADIKVKRVDCALDCGYVVNPDGVIAQVESAVIFGLSAALRGEITFDDGAVVQSNFDNFELPRMNEAPPIHVHLMPSDAAPQGVGEPALPVIAPALANAIFAATGKRLRALPLGLA